MHENACAALAATSLVGLDFVVIGLYFGVLLGIGAWFALTNKATEDYLLAGRSMGALPVGLSYFATMFSTVSYLSIPGEIVRHGPVIICSVASLPFVYAIVGRILIPRILSLQVNTAYEILERRFGLSVRVFGMSVFLLLRLSWMATILYGMSYVVLTPILGLPDTSAPLVAGGLGLITIAYTSLGGLKAVIWTDVLQTLVLVCGASVPIILIANWLGGPLSWVPENWATHWDEPRIWFDPSARITVATIVLSQFTWYVCTAGSDQMALQRYMATSGCSSARKMFGMSLICDTIVAILLGVLGLALFSFASQHPSAFPLSHPLSEDADQLFPVFVATLLPAGLSGLVIAGLAAAAMSSLSSGISSASLVVTHDIVNRICGQALSDRLLLWVARCASVTVGVVVVAASILLSRTESNLLEVAFRFINLFTAPLFVLFFMAMFVRNATVAGAWIAGLVSLGTAVFVVLGKAGLSVFWVMPVALGAGIGAGLLSTLLPLGVIPAMLDRDDKR